MSDKKFNLKAEQKSGVASQGDQNQTIQYGEHNHFYSGGTFQKLLSLKDSQITVEPNSLKGVITAISDGIDEVDYEGFNDRTFIDINEKNEINNHSAVYFETFVEIDFYPQFKKIDAFLKLRANQELQPTIDRVINSLNRKIIAFQGDDPFECVLLKLTDQLVEKYYDQLADQEETILLILYYFYCNCCIGKKTKGNTNVATE